MRPPDRCNACGGEIPAGTTGPCPHCHADVGRKIGLGLGEGAGFTDSGAVSRIRTWREWRWSILIIAIILTLASAISGFGGAVGVALGVVLGLIGTVIGFWASTSHKDSETTRF